MTSEQAARRPKLSVAMIVRDEAAVLADTIENVCDIADDIFVLDTGSTDDTIRIAEKAGARVATLPWTDDFSAARNCAMDQIESDWILWLDAGETLSAESKSAFRQFIDREADPRKVYMLMVVLPSADPSSSAEQAARMRLLPNLPGLHFRGRVRETLEASLAGLGLSVDMAPARIQRHRRENLPARKANKARRNLRIVAAEGRRVEKLPVSLLLAAGEALSDLQETEKARQAFLQAKQLAERGSTEMLDAYYGLLTTFDGIPELRDQQLSVGLEALEIFPLDAQLLCAMGSYLQMQNRLDLAERSFETAVQYGQVDLETWHLAEIAEMAAVCLALTQQLSGNNEKAREVLLDALQRFPDSVRVRRHLIDLVVKLGQVNQALELVGALVGTTPLPTPWRNAVLGACKAASKDWLPALGYLQSAYVGGCHDAFCLRWLVVTLISNGQMEAARPVLDQWLEREPNNNEALAYLSRMEARSREENLAKNLRVDRAGRGTTAPLPPLDAASTATSPPLEIET
ncbi:MAG: glycosyltransferase [Planctomycetaceae bacterium]|nr:glycosyltransferase [Planctomycetaceae bacterium]